MISRLYSVQDLAVGAFGTPMLHVNDVVAQRGIMEFFRTQDGVNSELYRYSESYSLYYLGEFDTDTGLISPERVPMLVARVSDLKPGQ